MTAQIQSSMYTSVTWRRSMRIDRLGASNTTTGRSSVRLHFGNSPGGLGLKPQSIPDRLAELRQIFVDVATRHPDAVAVRGCSWLYHVPTYRSLFPSMYIDGLASAGYLHQFAALWGQFLDRHGKVKEALRETFIRDIGIARSLCDLNLVFPRDVLATTCPIGIFYRHFGVE